MIFFLFCFLSFDQSLDNYGKYMFFSADLIFIWIIVIYCINVVFIVQFELSGIFRRCLFRCLCLTSNSLFLLMWFFFFQLLVVFCSIFRGRYNRRMPLIFFLLNCFLWKCTCVCFKFTKIRFQILRCDCVRLQWKKRLASFWLQIFKACWAMGIMNGFGVWVRADVNMCVCVNWFRNRWFWNAMNAKKNDASSSSSSAKCKCSLIFLHLKFQNQIIVIEAWVQSVSYAKFE